MVKSLLQLTKLSLVSTNLNQNQESVPLSFEAAFARLEEILEQLNTGTISLDESLQLYEEADQLIAICNKRLNDAERKIEMLVKNRNGELTLGNDEKPLTHDYKLTLQTHLTHK
jgi:exodeoxyribonuclease VII small subunit